MNNVVKLQFVRKFSVFMDDARRGMFMEYTLYIFPS